MSGKNPLETPSNASPALTFTTSIGKAAIKREESQICLSFPEREQAQALLKYGRDGHLFKERFKSEPVNDMAYFTTLLRYIHQNPVKAGIVELVKDYEYSSWCEYDGSVEPVFQICNTQTVLNRIPFPDLEAWVNEPLPEDVNCLDIEDSSRRRPSDDQIWNLIKEKTGVTNNSAFQQLDNDTKQQVFLELKDSGASLRQLERLTGIGKGVIHRIWNSSKP